MRWKAIGSGLYCPVAVSRQPGEVILLARGATAELLMMEWAGGGWSELRSLGFPAARTGALSEPLPADWQLAACTRGGVRIDVFGRSPDGDLLHMSGDGENWGSFDVLGAPATSDAGVAIPLGLTGAPAACGSVSDRVDVFATGQTGELLHTFRDGVEWSGFESLGIPVLEVAGAKRSVPLSGSVAACRCGTDRMALFVRGSSGDLMMKWWDGKAWSEFASLGWPELEDETYPAVTFTAPLTGPPAACSWGPDRMDVFARGARGEIVHKWWNGREWSDFSSLGMPVTADAERQLLPSAGAVAACSWGTGRLDVFTRAVDGRLHHCWWDGTWDHQ